MLKLKGNVNKYDLGFATLCILCLFWIPLSFYVNHIEFMHQFEESTGYRYFYSLRYAFSPEIVWLPQGQLVTLYHALIQHLLTFLGLPNDQLFPRIWIFCVVVNVLPMLLSWVALIRLSSRFKYKVWPFLVMTCFVFLMSSNGLPGGATWLILPDYHIWVIPLTIFAASLLPFEDENLGLNNSNFRYMTLGLLLGLSACIKITFILIPGSILLVDLFNQPRSLIQAGKLSLIALLTGLAVTLSIFYIMVHLGSMAEFGQYLQQNIAFAIQGDGGMSAISFEDVSLESWFVFLCVATVFVYACIFQRRFLAIGIAGLLYTAFVLRRFYSHSFIEYHAFAFIPLYVLVYLLSTNRWIAEQKWVNYLLYVIIYLVIYLTSNHFSPKWIRDTQAHHQMISRAASHFHHALQEGPSPIWILTSENSYRPYTIESALCKGGMNVNSAYWGIDSPYIANLFPHFKCVVYAHRLSNEEKKKVLLGTIGFAGYFTESFADVIKRIEKDFEISLAHSECKEIPDSQAQRLIYCYPEHLS